MTRQNGDKLFRQRRLRGEFVSTLRRGEMGKREKSPSGSSALANSTNNNQAKFCIFLANAELKSVVRVQKLLRQRIISDKLVAAIHTR